MLPINYDIKPDFFQKLQDIKLRIVSKLPSISNRIRKLNLHTGLIDAFNRSLTKTLIYSEGLKNITLKCNDPEEAAEAYPKAKDTFFKNVKFISRIESAHYFYNADTKRICDGIIDNFYAVESHLRRTAFSDSQSDTEKDKDLTEFASYLSLSSVNS